MSTLTSLHNYNDSDESLNETMTDDSDGFSTSSGETEILMQTIVAENYFNNTEEEYPFRRYVYMITQMLILFLIASMLPLLYQ